MKRLTAVDVELTAKKLIEIGVLEDTRANLLLIMSVLEDGLEFTELLECYNNLQNEFYEG